MAQATNTQLGEIQLAGDLAGNGSAQVGTNPQLKTMPGIVPGQYIVPRITVDSKGRVAAIENGIADIAAMLPSASANAPGVVSIGDNIYVAEDGEPGFWTANFGGTLTLGSATGLSNQACATFGFDVAVDNGPTQSIRVTGDDAQTVSNLINEINAKMTGAVCGLINGNFVITSISSGNNSRIQVSNISLFACMTGFVSIGGETAGLGSCEIYVKRGSTSDYGVIKVGNGILVEDGVISVEPGVIPTATATSQGGVIVPAAGNLVVDTAGNLSVPTASLSTPGVVKVGAGLTVSGGALSVSMPNATNSTKGVVRIGANINVTDGVISIADSNATTIGVAKIGDGLSVTDGVVSLNVASATTLGAVKGGGTGISIAADGTLSAAELVVPDATTSVKGIVQIGTGISVASGVISIAVATTTTKGVVQVSSAANSGLSVTAGVISANLATTTAPGVVSVAAGGNFTLTAGVLDINPGSILTTSSPNTFTKAQVSALYDQGTSTSTSLNLVNSNMFKWAPSGAAMVISSVAGAVAGGIYTVVITTPVGAQTISFPTTFKFAYGQKPTPSNNGKDILTMVYDGTNYLCTYVRGIK